MSSKNHPPLKVLLAIDGSEHSSAATNITRDFLWPDGSKITLVSVLAPLRYFQHPVLESALSDAQIVLKESGAIIDAELLHGHPASPIVKFADQFEPDLIILGAQGLRSTMGILLGGVAQQVVEYAN